jgi:hypothetical protein
VAPVQILGVAIKRQRDIKDFDSIPVKSVFENCACLLKLRVVLV